MESDKREYFRVSVGRLTSVIKNSEGNFEVVDKSIKPLDTFINLKDVYWWVAHRVSKREFQERYIL